jgi:hypothetical protein
MTTRSSDICRIYDKRQTFVKGSSARLVSAGAADPLAGADGDADGSGRPCLVTERATELVVDVAAGDQLLVVRLRHGWFPPVHAGHALADA